MQRRYITQQRDIYDTVIFRFLQIFYGLTIRRVVSVRRRPETVEDRRRP